MTDGVGCVQAKNVVFNVSEMEAKVRDATNDEPWYVAMLVPRSQCGNGA